MESFLSGDFKKSEGLAARFPSRDSRSEEVAMIRALSLMKLGRFEEARPLLQNLRNNAASVHLRAQAAYSLGDSYYFENHRTQADIFYKEALERYPDYGEAQQVRRLLGLSHPSYQNLGVQAAPLQQGGLEEILIYSVQVGSFSKRRNAERLLNKLLRKKLDAYIAQDETSRHFRVRIGHLTAREDARSLESRLKKDGYPTKIFP